jgi:hypothetical protein
MLSEEPGECNTAAVWNQNSAPKTILTSGGEWRLTSWGKEDRRVLRNNFRQSVLACAFWHRGRCLLAQSRPISWSEGRLSVQRNKYPSVEPLEK